VSIPLLDVADLVGHPGASRAHDVVGTLDGLASELVRVPDEAPIRAEVLLESVIEGILVSGEVTGTWTVSCARCLTPGDGTFRARLSELCTTDALEDDDTYPFDPELGLDLGQMLRDAIGIEMPFAPLARFEVSDRDRFRQISTFSHLDSDTTVGTLYRYRVVSFTVDGYVSAPSNVVTVERTAAAGSVEGEDTHGSFPTAPG